MYRNRNKGFSLTEVIVVVAIMAVLLMVLLPSLLRYTEDSRAQKDETSMDEVINAVQLALADQNCFDEMLHYSIDNNYITYTDSSGVYGQIIADGEFWAPDGSGRATTITFNPEEGPQSKTQYRLDKAIVNDMTYGNGSVANDRVISGTQAENVQCYFKNASINGKQTGHTYNEVRQTIGDDVITTSQTYKNSSFTIFIIFTQKDGTTVADVNGSFNGTNLDIGAPASKGSGTDDYIIDKDTNTPKPNGTDSGQQKVNYTQSDLSSSGSFFGNTNVEIKDYMDGSDAQTSLEGTLSTVYLGDFINAKKPTALIFTTVPATGEKDVSVEQNGSVVAWMEGSTCYVASIQPNKKVYIGNSMEKAFSGERHTAYKNVELFSVGALDVKDSITFQKAFNYTGSNANSFKIIGLDDWNVSKSKTMASMFSYCGQNATTFDIGNISGWDISNVTSLSHMFNYAGRACENFNLGNLNSWNTSKVQHMEHMFNNAGKSAKHWYIGDLSTWKTGLVVSLRYMFTYTGIHCQEFKLNLSTWNTSNVTDMTSTFHHAGAYAKSCSLGRLDNWNTSKVTSMSGMFSDCGASVTLDLGNLGNWDVSNVTTLKAMFYTAGGQGLYVGNLANWDVSKVKNISHMFSYYAKPRKVVLGDIGGWDTSNVVTAWQFIYNVNVDEKLDLSAWNTDSMVNYPLFSSNSNIIRPTFTQKNLNDMETGSELNNIR